MRAVDHRQRRLHREHARRAAGRRRLVRGRRRLVHPLLRPGGQAAQPGRPGRRAALRPRPARRRERRPRRAAPRPSDGLPPRRPAGCPEQLRHRVRPVPARQRPGHPARLRGRAPRPAARGSSTPRRRRCTARRPDSAFREDTTPTVPRSPYGVTKLTCERLADVYRHLGLDVVGLRYFTVYGPRQRPDMAIRRLCEAALGGTPFPPARRRQPVAGLHLRRRRRRRHRPGHARRRSRLRCSTSAAARRRA